MPMLLVVAMLQAGPLAARASSGQDEAPDVRLFFQAMSRDAVEAQAALAALARSWRDGYAGGTSWRSTAWAARSWRSCTAPCAGP